MASVKDEAAAVAERFLHARRSAGGLSEFPADLPTSLSEAYAVQDHAIAGWHRPILGWKVGRIHPPLSQQLGADRLAGPMFLARSVPADGSPVDMPVFGEGSAAGEAEFLLRVARAPDPAKSRYTLDETADLIDAVHVGIEVASSPLVAINDVGPLAVVSDFGNNNGILIGAPIPDWRNSGFEDWDVTTLIDGEVAGRGRASSFPDGAIGAARFLFELLAARGIGVAAGQWISSGAVTGVHDARPGQLVEARFGSGLAVSARFVEARPE